MENTVHLFYGNRLRMRACGICVNEDKLLLVNHLGLTERNFWSPPGGEIQFGESASQCIEREFLEETSLKVEVKNFLFACEFIKAPLHAIELFFMVSHRNDKITIGYDPEPGSPQLITAVKFTSWDEISSLPVGELHGIFRHLQHPSKILSLSGYFKV